MRQSVPVRPALLSLAIGTSFALSPPATASQGPHAQPPAASARRLPAPDLLALPRIDIPLPEHRPGDDTVQLAAGEVLSLELPIAITALFEPGWEDLDETQQEILAPFAPEWNTWPIAEKRSWLAFADRMQQLPEAQRQRARRRILEWANMSPEERRIARLNYQNARRRPMPERVKEWERYQSFSYAERERLRHSEQAHDIAAAQRTRRRHAAAPRTHAPATGRGHAGHHREPRVHALRADAAPAAGFIIPRTAERAWPRHSPRRPARRPGHAPQGALR